MNEQQLIKFLKKNLKIEIEDDGRFLTVRLLINDKIITETTEQVYR